jgi:hypothetical protein
MRTLILQIAEPGPDPQRTYRVNLFIDEGQSNWSTVPRATGVIPGDCPVDPPVLVDADLLPPSDIPSPPGARVALDPQKVQYLYDIHSNRPEVLDRIGTYLYRLAVRGDVAEAWNLLRDQYPRE